MLWTAEPWSDTPPPPPLGGGRNGKLENSKQKIAGKLGNRAEIRISAERTVNMRRESGLRFYSELKQKVLFGLGRNGA